MPLNLLAFFGLLTNAFIWGVSWIPFRYLFGQGIHSLWATGMMYTLIALGFWLLNSVDKKAVKPSAETKGPLLALLICTGITNCAFNWAVTIGEVVRVVLLFYLMPIWTLLLARIFLNEKLTLEAWLRIVLCLTGAALVLTPQGETFPIPNSLADVLGILGGLFFAATNVALRANALVATPARNISLAMFTGGAILPSLLAGALVATGTIAPLPPFNFAWVAILLVVAIAFLISNLALQYGAARLKASVIAAVMPSEVVFASVSAVLIGGEVLTTRLVIGGLLIMAAALLSIFGEK